MAQSDPTLLFSGQGVVQIADRTELGRPKGFLDIGNVSALEFEPQVEREEHKESRTGSNFVDAVFEHSQSVNVTMTCDSFDIENLKLYLYGTSEAIAASTITDEAIIAYPGRKVALASMNPLTFTSLTDDGGTTTYTEGTDYAVNLKTGMLTLPSTASFSEGDILRANYSAGAENLAAAFTRLNTYLYLRFDGLNRASDGKEVVIEAYRVRFDPSQLPVINESFAEYELSGMALYDNLNADNSQYGGFMRIRTKG